jgi:MFS family permease
VAEILRSSWALLLGLLLLMLGNGLQGSLLGVRGAYEGFDATTMAWVMSAYFLGFLGGSRLAPTLIQRVGHVRVFAALGSLVSAAFILYPVVPNPLFWSLMRLMVGFCFAGIYVVCESWLNTAATNETRGQALSLYLLVQMVGIISAQGLLNIADPGGYPLFVIMSVLVSISFAPILLSVAPAPSFDTIQPMSLRELFHVSPLGVVGTFLMGGGFAAILGMSAVFGAMHGLSVAQISIFVASIYVGGMLLQYPFGYLSDRMDRRLLIVIITVVGPVMILALTPFIDSYTVLLVLGFLIGGIINPLYSLIVAYTNDFLEPEQMAAASSGLLYSHGFGAVGAPLLLGWVMDRGGSGSYFAFIAGNLLLIAAYGIWRMTRRASVPVDEQSDFPMLTPQTTPMAAMVFAETAHAEHEDDLPQTQET